MSKNKNPNGEQPSPPNNDVSIGEIEHRLTTLENSLNEVRKSHLEGHKWFTTIMFTLVGVLLVYTGNQSKNDVREATRDMKSDLRNSVQDMQAKVDGEIDEIDKKFAALSGEALKKPLVEISDSQGPLDGQVFEISQNSPIPFYPLFFKNIGDKRTDPISVQLCMSSDIFMNGNDEWMRTATDDKIFPFSYYSSTVVSSRTMGVGIAPQETWPLQGDNFGSRISPAITNVISCKLKVFYGAEKPAEANFTIKFR